MRVGFEDARPTIASPAAAAMTDAADLAPDAFPPDDASGLSDAELRALLARAKEANDEPLRRLIASYLILRRLAADMVTLIETREGSITVVRTPLFSRIKNITKRSRE